MNKQIIDKLYVALPVFLQNVAVALKGYQLKSTRISGEYKRCRAEIKGRDDWQSADFDLYQLKALNDIVEFAIENTEYYSKAAANEFKRLNSIDELQKIPVLTKETILKNYEQFVSRAEEHSSLLTVHTTGTTGTPLAVKCDSRSRQINYAFFDNYLQSIGLDSDKKHIVIGGRVVVPHAASRAPFWRNSFFQRSLLMSSYHLSDSYLPHYVDKIASYAPEYIESYPSSIYRIAMHLLQTGRNIKVNAIVTSAETLSEEQRAAIEEAFCCKVYDQYGSAEMSVFVAQCINGSYHVRPDYGVLEILDDDGSPVPKGEVGNVVCTGFLNRAFPLIRYSIGDMAALGSRCECGLNTPILSSIEGRKDDVIRTADGRSIGRLSPVLKGFPILKAQYAQYELQSVQLTIVPSKGFDKKLLPKIKNEVKKRLGESMRIDIQLVDEIPIAPGGKFRAVVSYLK